MKAIIIGSTGMVGGILLELCTQSNQISEIIAPVRRPLSDTSNPKVKPVVIKDFNTYDNQEELFDNVGVVFFCLGVYTGQVSTALLQEITVDYAANCAKLVAKYSPKARFCLLSGYGADRTEKSRTAFARFKGMAENQIAETSLEFYTFRPMYIYPVTPRVEPNITYSLSRAVYKLIKFFGGNLGVTSIELASSMFNVGLQGAQQEILENSDILDYK